MMIMCQEMYSEETNEIKLLKIISELNQMRSDFWQGLSYAKYILELYSSNFISDVDNLEK